ncbi:hypothetical protein C8Q69DRAFT_466482 [Paecilomyces variotii]|uniref:Uncharacterized protein n=1 Tax=Byssochlamys spectabilis TaxID=264951 RepID=A0A443HUR5_BYSSP|nr:hypothetical protein C8Q69DRAFT_466482 [Paecilomyces variotii]RWQ95565.1 hypothetical protein C8Q69DRAFT_466482 [Paecilomyces variotii]
MQIKPCIDDRSEQYTRVLPDEFSLLSFFFSFLFVVFPFRFPLSFRVWEYLVGGSIAILDLLLPFCMLFFFSLSVKA